jgi:hypothetical protein
MFYLCSGQPNSNEIGRWANAEKPERLAHGFTSGLAWKSVVPLKQQAVAYRVIVGSFQSAARLRFVR